MSHIDLDVEPSCLRSFNSYDAEFNNVNDIDHDLDVDGDGGFDISTFNNCTLLMPFEHQVGGHTAVMKFDAWSVCKPNNPTELQFYKTLPEIMRDVVPLFKGLVDVYIEEETGGVLTMRACPEGARKQQKGCIMDSGGEDFDSDEDALEAERRLHGEQLINERGLKNPAMRRRSTEGCCRSNSKPKSCCKPSRKLSSSSSTSSFRGSEKSPACCWVRVKNSGNLCIDTSSEDESEVMFEDQSDTNRSVTGVRNAGCNPWSMYCQLQQFLKMRRPENVANSYKFMVLEDCTSNYHFPCILDLKIGTRSHNDLMTEAKKQSHIAKVAATTSATVGVRAAGMQVFHVDRGRYVCRNKYYGRRLNEQGLREAFCKFLYNGNNFRYEVIPQLCREIQQLIVIIRQLSGYRFYGSSLLLIYEGLPPNLASFPFSSSSSSDDECLTMRRVSEKHADVSCCGGVKDSVQPGSDSTPRTISASGSKRRGKTAPSSHCATQSFSVSLKMIDFGSVSFSESHEGPDHGYIYGLQNVLQILRHIESGGLDGGCDNLVAQCAMSFPP